jgi:hypothetical protein
VTSRDVDPPTPTLTSGHGGWRRLGLVVLGLALIVVSAVVWWWNDDGDLRRAEERARAAGMKTSWSEYGLTISPPSDLDTWRQIEGLLRPKHFDPWLAADSKRMLLKFPPGTGIPDEMRAWHAAFTLMEVAELDRLIDALPQRLIWHDRFDYETQLTYVGAHHKLVNLLYERMLVAAASDRPVIARRMLKIATIDGARGLVTSAFERTSLTKAWKAITYALDDIRMNDPRLGGTVRSLCDEIVDDYRTSFADEWLTLYSSLAAGIPLNFRPGVYGPGWDPRVWRMTVETRVGRAGQLGILLECHRICQIPSLFEHAPALSALDASWEHSGNPLVRGSHNGHEVYLDMLKSLLRCRLYGLLIASELLGETWPSDPCAPAGMPLKRIERDGRLIGTYSLGMDGIDNGGDPKADMVFPLYGDPDAP